MKQKFKQHGFLRVLWFLKNTKKVEIWSDIKARIRTPGTVSGLTKNERIRPDPDPQHCLESKS
jgi:hypothetical protein